MRYQLPNNFYTMPEMARTTCTTKELKELMMDTSGKCFAQCRSWDIKKKSLGAGVYEIYLKQTFKNESVKKNNLKNIKLSKIEVELLLKVLSEKTVSDFDNDLSEPLSNHSFNHLIEKLKNY